MDIHFISYYAYSYMRFVTTRFVTTYIITANFSILQYVEDMCDCYWSDKIGFVAKRYENVCTNFLQKWRHKTKAQHEEADWKWTRSEVEAEVEVIDRECKVEHVASLVAFQVL